MFKSSPIGYLSRRAVGGKQGRHSFDMAIGPRVWVHQISFSMEASRMRGP